MGGYTSVVTWITTVAVGFAAPCELSSPEPIRSAWERLAAESSDEAAFAFGLCLEEAGLGHAAQVHFLDVADGDGPLYADALGHAFAVGESIGDLWTLSSWAERIPGGLEPNEIGADAVWFAWARAMADEDRNGDAVIALQEVSDQFRFAGEVALIRGESLRTTDPDAARDAFVEALDPAEAGSDNRDTALFRLADLEVGEGRLAEAASWLVQVRSDSPWYAHSRAMAAEVARVVGARGLARRWLRDGRQAVRRGDWSPGAEVTHARMLADRCHVARAARVIDAWVAASEGERLAFDAMAASHLEADRAVEILDGLVGTKLPAAILSRSLQEAEMAQLHRHRGAVLLEREALGGVSDVLFQVTAGAYLEEAYTRAEKWIEELMAARFTAMVEAADKQFRAARKDADDARAEIGASCQGAAP